MNKNIPCPHCQRRFGTNTDLAQHTRSRHRIKPERPRRDDDDSLADIAVEAEMKQAMGEELNDLEKAMLS